MKKSDNQPCFLFDLYGTLVDIRTDEESARFWKRIAAMLGCDDAPRIKARYLALCREESAEEEREADLMRVFEKLLQEFGYGGDAASFAYRFRTASLQKLKLFDGAAEILDGLRLRGAKLFLLSNAQACFTRRELDGLGLTEKFDGILLSSEAGWKKPSEKFFEAAFEKFSLAPEDCVYVGNDLRDDVLGAHRAGMRAVYIKTEQSGTYNDGIVPDVAVKNHRQLKEILLGGGKL